MCKKSLQDRQVLQSSEHIVLLFSKLLQVRRKFRQALEDIEAGFGTVELTFDELRTMTTEQVDELIAESLHAISVLVSLDSSLEAMVQEATTTTSTAEDEDDV